MAIRSSSRNTLGAGCRSMLLINPGRTECISPSSCLVLFTRPARQEPVNSRHHVAKPEQTGYTKAQESWMQKLPGEFVKKSQWKNCEQSHCDAYKPVSVP